MSLPTDRFVTLQGSSSSSFTPPPLDGSLVLHQLYDFHGKHSPNHPLYVYEDPQGAIKTMTWADAQRGIHRASLFATKALAGLPGNATPPPTIAILANSDMITFQCFLVGLMRAGYQPFPISIRNSKFGVANMFLQTASQHLFVSADDSMQGVAKNALEEIKKEGRDAKILAMPTFEDLFPENDSLFELLSPTITPDLDAPALILHSSGSTAFPKLRTLTHRILLQWSRTPWFGERDLCGETLSVHALPLFHASGFFHTCWAPSTGMTLSLFHPANPPVVLTPDRQIASCKATGATLLFAVPSFMETWTGEPDSVEYLKGLKGLIFGGAPLSKSAGDALESAGVSLWHIYGATEFGIAASCMPKESIPHGWEYIKFSPHVSPVLVPQDDEGIFELALLPSTTHTPSVLNGFVHDNKDAYHTNDLFIEHPTAPGFYKIHGRADDQIMLSTGEKTNPGPLEHIISRSPLVANALMFGRGKFQNGVIIEPSQPFDPTDSEKLAKFRNDVWPFVEQANAFAPTHSRIFKEMILVCKPDKPFEYTPKRNPRRHVSVALYNDEIEAAYAAVEASAQTDITPPAVWSREEALKFMRKIVARVMKSPVGDDDDLFEHGCDSLQATYIRNAILHALRESSVNSSTVVGPSFVFEYPSISELATTTNRLMSQTILRQIEPQQLALANGQGNTVMATS